MFNLWCKEGKSHTFGQSGMGKGVGGHMIMMLSGNHYCHGEKARERMLGGMTPNMSKVCRELNYVEADISSDANIFLPLGSHEAQQLGLKRPGFSCFVSINKCCCEKEKEGKSE